MLQDGYKKMEVREGGEMLLGVADPWYTWAQREALADAYRWAASEILIIFHKYRGQEMHCSRTGCLQRGGSGWWRKALGQSGGHPKTPAAGEQLAGKTNRLQGNRQPVRWLLGICFTCRSKERPVNY